jgi:hypothetical protein
MRCSDCGWKYPDALLSPAFINGEYTYDICGPCALNAINKETGMNRIMFGGRMAEANRIAALKWRERHPEDAPIKES